MEFLLNPLVFIFIYGDATVETLLLIGTLSLPNNIMLLNHGIPLDTDNLGLSAMLSQSWP